MNSGKINAWRPGKRDAVFLSIVAAVLLLLVYGTSERTTKAVPDDETHRTVTTREQCMSCHGAEGVRPQPAGHIQGGQCFQCHIQPKGWMGGSS